jgi:hypothetical protein
MHQNDRWMKFLNQSHDTAKAVQSSIISDSTFHVLPSKENADETPIEFTPQSAPNLVSHHIEAQNLKFRHRFVLSALSIREISTNCCCF